MRRGQQQLWTGIATAAFILIVLVLLLGYASFQLGIFNPGRNTGTFSVDGFSVRYDVPVNDTLSADRYTYTRTTNIYKKCILDMDLGVQGDCLGIIDSIASLSNTNSAVQEIDTAIGACLQIDVAEYKEIAVDFSVESATGNDRDRHSQTVSWPGGSKSCETDNSNCAVEARPVLKLKYEPLLGKYRQTDSLGNTDLVLAPSELCIAASAAATNDGATKARTTITFYDVVTIDFDSSDETPAEFNCLALEGCDNGSEEDGEQSGNDADDGTEELGFWKSIGAWFAGIWDKIAGWIQ